MVQIVKVAGTKIVDAANAERFARVSTIWAVDDHVDGAGTASFETMTFTASGEEFDIQRYTTEAEAREGHAIACRNIAAMMTDPVQLDVDG